MEASGSTWMTVDESGRKWMKISAVLQAYLMQLFGLGPPAGPKQVMDFTLSAKLLLFSCPEQLNR